MEGESGSEGYVKERGEETHENSYLVKEKRGRRK